MAYSRDAFTREKKKTRESLERERDKRKTRLRQERDKRETRWRLERDQRETINNQDTRDGDMADGLTQTSKTARES